MLAPQADTARPAARMFLAALRSRSCRVRQSGHVQRLVLSLSSGSRYPHAEQILDDGNHLSTAIRFRPYRAHLYSSCRLNSPQPQAEMALASLRFFTMFLTARSSTTITSA